MPELTGDQVYVETGERVVNVVDLQRFANIQVYGPGDAQMPSLPFLHKGDVFCDGEGNAWRVVKATQEMTTHRYADEDSYPVTFHWEYETVLVED